ncbi:hypothetical protein GCM10010991_02740 [Gemmobacter aquaticus]|jgi:hypothetical protein|uniref:Uncharacterized protein n=1 Tax=Gemmobacter aquaticus TaxID=490185 RepID=A0A917YGT3_9RHOB|nr:hypothetical protein [Gemmobacter aquaticus]GGO24402.1 hypothetical protein GCM10010991_02740 [Gemmobacter aquaticus]
MTDREKTDMQASLETLFTEMQALMGLMPAKHHAEPAEGQDAVAAQARRTTEDEAIEAGFDNMPV